jgi:hypothetical protein
MIAVRRVLMSVTDKSGKDYRGNGGFCRKGKS